MQEKLPIADGSINHVLGRVLSEAADGSSAVSVPAPQR